MTAVSSETAVDNVAVARRWHADIYLKGDLDAADEICAPDMEAHGTGVAADAPRGPQFVKDDAAGFRAAFAFELLQDDDVIAVGDKVVIRWTFVGTHVGQFLGVEATGRRVTLEGIDIFEVRGGRITQFWNAFDLLGLALRLGAVGEFA